MNNQTHSRSPKSTETPDIVTFRKKIEKIAQLESNGELQSAEIEAEQLTQNYPSSYVSWNIYGNICRKRTDPSKAEKAFRQATRLNPNSYESFLNLGLILKSQKYHMEAITALERAHTLRPTHPQLVLELANLCKDTGNIKKSIEYYENTISLNPQFLLKVYYDYSQMLYNNKKYTEAVAIYKKIIEAQPNNAQAHNNLGNCLQNLDNLPDAIQAYEAAIKLKADYSEAFTHLGLALRSLGEKEKAVSALKSAIKHNEGNSNAYLYLSELKTFESNDPQVEKMTTLIGKTETAPSDKSNLLFALGKAHEDCGQYYEAFQSYKEANRIKKSILKTSIERDKYIFGRIKEVSENISHKSIIHKPQMNNLSPIFILGMPRSGTTLIEQIVSCHSKVQAAGELNYVNKFGSSITLADKNILENDMETFQERYLGALSSHSNGKSFVTDKFPLNFLHIGLILHSLPNARIVHVKRDAAATCWSNFKNHFVFEGSAYNFDLEDVVTYYNLYIDLMDFWEERFPGKIFTLNYEALTNQPEVELRRLIKHIELDWEDACLNPQKNTRPVRTASHQQVRKEIYKGSSHEWTKFKEHIGSAFDKLPMSMPN